jgi:hypothetical protein
MSELSDVPSFPHWGGKRRGTAYRARYVYTGEWNPSPGAGSGSIASEGGGPGKLRRGFPGGGGLGRGTGRGRSRKGYGRRGNVVEADRHRPAEQAGVRQKYYKLARIKSSIVFNINFFLFSGNFSIFTSLRIKRKLGS